MGKKNTEIQTFEAAIEKFSHDGRGIARISGKTTFMAGGLPGETVVGRYLRRKKDFDEGEVLEVVTASPQRVAPRCTHYSLCGGCSLQHLTAEAQIKEKEAQFKDLLQRIGHVEPQTYLSPLTGPTWNYRYKARLSVRYVEKKHSTLVGFREKNNPRYITEITHCPVLHPAVDQAIPALRQLLASFEDVKSIAQIEVAAGDTEVALIFRNLNPLSASDEQKLRVFADTTQFRIFLQPGGPTSVYLFYPEDQRTFLTYTHPDHKIQLQFFPTDFTQVNTTLNRFMVSRAIELLALSDEDVVLDLFCGLGNFSLPIARYCQAVVGVEGSMAMVERASMNATANGLSNTEFLCANLEEDTIFDRLKNKQFTKVLLDPPRTGALAMVNAMHRVNPKRIVYVSCNPATLARDAAILVNEQGYQWLAAGVMDMFVHTTHVEAIAVFEKR